MTTPDDTPRPPLSGEEAVKLTARYMFAAWVDQHGVRLVMEALEPKSRAIFLEAAAEHRAERDDLPLEKARSIERIYTQGYEDGVGRQRAQMLVRILTHRFGPLSEEHTDHIRQADDQTRRRWLNDALTVSTLDDLLTG